MDDIKVGDWVWHHPTDTSGQVLSRFECRRGDDMRVLWALDGERKECDAHSGNCSPCHFLASGHLVRPFVLDEALAGAQLVDRGGDPITGFRKCADHGWLSKCPEHVYLTDQHFTGHRADGRFREDGIDSCYDLFILVAEQEQAQAGRDGWVAWAGGECPVAGGKVDIKLKNGRIYNYIESYIPHWDWLSRHSDIVAYRVHEPAKAAPSSDWSMKAHIHIPPISSAGIANAKMHENDRSPPTLPAPDYRDSARPRRQPVVVGLSSDLYGIPTYSTTIYTDERHGSASDEREWVL